MCVCVSVCACGNVCVHINVCACVCLCVYVGVFVCARVCVRMSVGKCVYKACANHEGNVRVGGMLCKEWSNKMVFNIN